MQMQAPLQVNQKQSTATGNSEQSFMQVIVKPTLRQQALLDCPADTVFFGGSRGGGKCSPVDSQVFTPFGFRRLGDLKVGNIVSGKDGRMQQVVGVYDQGLQDIYEIEFIDGAKAECTLDHLWLVKKTCTRNKKRNGMKVSEGQGHDWSLWTFEMMKEWLDKKESTKDHKTIKKQSLLIPLCDPVKITKSYKVDMRPIDPYTLGTLLGNGYLNNSSYTGLTTADPEIIARARKHYKWKQSGDACNEFYSNDKDLLHDLGRLGLRGKLASGKFIPESYKLAPLEMRWELLRGLMDAVGTADTRGHSSYCTVSYQLAKDIQWLVWSLGGKAAITESPAGYKDMHGELVERQLSYDIYINMPDNRELFHLPRKKERCSDMFNGGCGEMHRRIVGYRYVGKKEARCIAVSNPDSLYITNDFVVTHNTYGIGILIAHRIQKYGKYLRALFLRRSNPELEDAIDQYQELFAPVASWVASRNTFHFHNGATLRMGFIDRIDDIKKYQGKQYALIAFDEVTNFSSYNIIERMRGSLRNARGIPTQMILSGNPGGPLHTRLKMDFIDPYPAGGVLIPDGFSKRMNRMTYRCFIPSRLSDNPYLADTGYEDELRKSGTPTQVRQWLDGVWDATENAAFADLFNANIHFMNPFVIPKTWRISKSYDYGSSAPWACVWFAVSDGSDYMLPNGQLRPTIKGDIFVIYELYGWNGRPNEGTKESIQSQADKIKLVESSVFPGREMQVSIADSAIFASLSNYCIADEFSQFGIMWQRCNKFPGSREHGFKLMRERLIASRERDNAPGIFWFKRCRNSIRTIPGLQMERDGSDKVMGGKGSEDHLYDAICYFLLEQVGGEVESGATGNY